LALGGVPAQRIERRPTIAALSAADAMIVVDLRHLPAGPFCRPAQLVLLVGCGLVVPMMFFVPPGGAWRKRPVRRYVRAIRTERPEIVIGRMVLLNQDHQVFHSAFGSRGHLVLPAKRSLATRLPSPGAARSAERLHTTPRRL